MNEYLSAINSYNLMSDEEWLISYFELYKKTLIWPKGKPAIPRCGMETFGNRFKLAFHNRYKELLSDLGYTLDDTHQKLVVNNLS